MHGMDSITRVFAEDAVDAVGIRSGDRAIVLIIGVVALLGLVAAVYFRRVVLAADAGTPRMQEIAHAVQEGAAAYLRRQFKTLVIFAIGVFFVLFALPAADANVKLGRSLFFLVGAAFSAAVGYLGMTLATRANVRVAAAAREAGRQKAMHLSFRAGGVVGMATVGLGLFGAAVILVLYNQHAPEVLEGYGLGGALLAMFMRVGGGIFTKAADVGADLVGKVEQNIPEDDPRNAATIADNVGDNVGDCAGMAADLFESYAVTLVAALILGQLAFGAQGLVFPLLVPAIGVVTALIGVLSVVPRARDRSGMSAINRGFFISAVVALAAVLVTALVYLPGKFGEFTGAARNLEGNPAVSVFLAVLIGIVLAAAIQMLTGYFTETHRRPVRDIGESSKTGPATVVLAGVAVGLESAVYSALLIAAAVYGAFLLGQGNTTFALFCVAMAGTGLLTTVGVIVSMDTFGPISDNAQGIAEMSHDVTGEGAQVLTDLDAVGNTTKAITKGIAIATAVLAATALFGSFSQKLTTALSDAGASVADFSKFSVLDVSSPNVLVGVIIGAAVVFFFSGLAINAVARAAGRVVFEVREQFRTRPGIMDGTERPDYGRVVDICTRDSLRELITPGLLAVLAPVAVGFALTTAPLGAFLAGAIAAGVLMAIFLANSGGAWDNAKKHVEDGNYGGKGSEAHAATVIGDTVGDPFKDTAGPALNPLIKVMNLVALLIAPAVVKLAVGPDKNTAIRLTIAAIAAVAIVAAVLAARWRRSPEVVDVVATMVATDEVDQLEEQAATPEPLISGPTDLGKR